MTVPSTASHPKTVHFHAHDKVYQFPDTPQTGTASSYSGFPQPKPEERHDFRLHEQELSARGFHDLFDPSEEDDAVSYTARHTSSYLSVPPSQLPEDSPLRALNKWRRRQDEQSRSGFNTSTHGQSTASGSQSKTSRHTHDSHERPAKPKARFHTDTDTDSMTPSSSSSDHKSKRTNQSLTSRMKAKLSKIPGILNRSKNKSASAGGRDAPSRADDGSTDSGPRRSTRTRRSTQKEDFIYK